MKISAKRTPLPAPLLLHQAWQSTRGAAYLWGKTAARCRTWGTYWLEPAPEPCCSQATSLSALQPDPRYSFLQVIALE